MKGYILASVEGKPVKPAIVNGRVIKGYFVDANGNIWTTKQSRPKKLSPNISGNCDYPRTTFFTDGNRLYPMFHRVVAETLIPFPVPEGITKKDWNNTPESVKSLFKSQFLVNHKDHDKTNYHPSNLEWVTHRGNARAYQNHRSDK